MHCKKDMDPRHGYGFLLLGFGMWCLPALQPAWFPPPWHGAMSARALWTEGMGLIQVGLGATVVLRRIAIPAYRRWAAVRKAAAARAFAPVRALPVRANLPGGLRSA
jgi:hypothetical protein